MGPGGRADDADRLQDVYAATVRDRGGDPTIGPPPSVRYVDEKCSRRRLLRGPTTGGAGKHVFFWGRRPQPPPCEALSGERGPAGTARRRPARASGRRGGCHGGDPGGDGSAPGGAHRGDP